MALPADLSYPNGPVLPVRPPSGRRVIYILSLRPAISFQKDEIRVTHSVHTSTRLTAGSRPLQNEGISSLVRYALTSYNPADSGSPCRNEFSSSLCLPLQPAPQCRPA